MVEYEATIAVLADDLTSALDSAAPFADRGLSVRVALNECGSFGGADVISFDLDSRFASSRDAEERFERAARQVAKAKIIYKTVDSTLRGNLGPEVHGVLVGSCRAGAVIAPAFPAAGRTTLSGHQFVDGVPLERTAFAQDVRNPVTTGRVADRLTEVDPSLYTIHDAADDRALDTLVAKIKLDADVVWVGSPGLSAALARAVPARPSTRTATWPRANRVLVAIGSLHSGNVEQAECLRRTGAAVVEADALADASSRDGLTNQLRSAFGKTNVVCLMSPRRVLMDGAHTSLQFAQQFAAVVADVSMEFDGLIATGGDTARRIVDALHATAIDLVGEAEPGVPIGILRLPGRDLTFITKAGGFGSAHTLQHCVRQLTT